MVESLLSRTLNNKTENFISSKINLVILKSIMGITQCIFCRLSPANTATNRNQHQRPVISTKEVYVIEDISPQARHHYLVIPHVHLPSITHLTRDDVPLLREMERVFREEQLPLLTELPSSGDEDVEIADPYTEIILGFHVPRFTSIQHLHMHCLIPPFRSTLGSLKYHEQTFPFISLKDAIDVLESGGRVNKVGIGEFIWSYIPRAWNNFRQLKRAARSA